MPVIAVKGGKDTGHGCYPPRASTEGDGTFRVNGVGVHCAGDAWGAHTCGDSTHAGTLQAGSPSFRVNGAAVGRISDPVSCGSVVAEGDSTFRVAG